MALTANDNRRVFWACTSITFCTEGTENPVTASAPGTCETAYGVQSVGVTTTFNLEQVFELGQIGIYENVEEVPDIEVTIEKVIDGNALLYDLATLGGTGGTVNMVSQANARKDVYFMISDEVDQSVNKHGVICYCSGMYVSSFSYTLPNEGNCTESITLVGNDKLWKTGGNHIGVGVNAPYAPRADANSPGGIPHDRLDHITATNGTAFVNEFGDIGSEHLATEAIATGVQRREDLELSVCIFPDDIYGVTTNAAGGANNDFVHINSVTINGDLGREAINELGSKLPYYRYVTFPVEIGCDIEVTTVSGDLVDAGSFQDNLAPQNIKLALGNGTIWELGTNNKLQSVTYTGGSTGGENATCTYSYQGFNSFTVNGGTNP